MSHGKMFSELPPAAKGIIAVVATGVVVWVGYKIYKSINTTDKENADKNIAKLTEDELKGNSKKMNPSFPLSQYPAFANQIYEGLRYAVGDDYGSVRDILMKMKNDLDVNLLSTAFGVRQAYFFGVPQGEKKDLFTFVRAELGNEYGGITSYKMDAVNKDWTKKGIKYSF